MKKHDLSMKLAIGSKKAYHRTERSGMRVQCAHTNPESHLPGITDMKLSYGNVIPICLRKRIPLYDV